MSHTAAQLQDAARPWRRNLRLYPWFYFFHDLQVWMPIWVIFSTEQIGLSFSELTLIGPFFYLIISFGQAPAGALADRFGRVNAMRAGCSSISASSSSTPSRPISGGSRWPGSSGASRSSWS